MSKNKIVLLSSVAAGLVLVSLVWFQFQASASVREFHHILAESKQEVFDMSQISSVDWNEVTFWGQGQSNCALGIIGLSEGDRDCKTIENEREYYVMLLKDNHLVESIPVNRRMIDFLKSSIPQRVTKTQAKFRFTTKGDFPIVKLEEPSSTSSN